MILSIATEKIICNTATVHPNPRAQRVGSSHRNGGGADLSVALSLSHSSPFAMSSPKLYLACCRGDKDLAKRLILSLQNSQVDVIGYVDPLFGDTPLYQACKRHWWDIVKLLIIKKCRIFFTMNNIYCIMHASMVTFML